MTVSLTREITGGETFSYKISWRIPRLPLGFLIFLRCIRLEVEGSGKTWRQDQRIRLQHVDTSGYLHSHKKKYTRIPGGQQEVRKNQNVVMRHALRLLACSCIFNNEITVSFIEGLWSSGKACRKRMVSSWRCVSSRSRRQTTRIAANGRAVLIYHFFCQDWSVKTINGIALCVLIEVFQAE